MDSLVRGVHYELMIVGWVLPGLMGAYVQTPDSEELSEAIEFVLDQPPKKQVICNGAIQWSGAVPNQRLKADNLLVYVRRVRNNLFHGGKFNGNWFEPERSEKLIQSCLIILKACVNHVEDTRNAYRG